MPRPTAEIWRIAITVPEHAVAGFETALEDFADAVTWFIPPERDIGDGGPWFVEGYARAAPDRPALTAALAAMAAALGVEAPEPCVERVPARDWVSENLRDFPPIRAGRFFVHGSHFEGRQPPGSLPLTVDAGTAFGSGEHATTWGCLIAIDRLARRRRFRRPLDVGCGSGILAMAMARTWPVPVLATDIDPQAARVAAFNAARNGLRGRVRAVTADGYRSRAVAAGPVYDLILANILARPLCRLARDLAAHLAPGGVAVLSGLLDRQERQVLAAHRRHGLSLAGRVAVKGWHTLILRR